MIKLHDKIAVQDTNKPHTNKNNHQKFVFNSSGVWHLFQ